MKFVACLILALILLGLDLPAPAGIVFFAGVVVQSIPGKYVIGVGQSHTRGRTRADEEQYLHEVAVDLGLEQETAQERRERIAEERYGHNKFAAGGLLGTGQNEYIDYDSNIVDVRTREIVGRARKR